MNQLQTDEILTGTFIATIIILLSVLLGSILNSIFVWCFVNVVDWWQKRKNK